MKIPTDIEVIVADANGVDDVAISIGDNGMFRIERLDSDLFWSCLYMPDGSFHTFHFRLDKRTIKVTHEKTGPAA